MERDLPCTPTGEGYLIAGFIGVFIARLLWGLTLGIAEACVERGPGVARVFGLFLLFPFVLVEAGAFAMVGAIRLGVIGVSLVALIALGMRVVQGRSHLRRGNDHVPPSRTP